MSRPFSRTRLAIAVVLAFACGVLFASGVDLTRFGYAQQGRDTSPPTAQEVKPLADASNAFVQIAQNVTPASCPSSTS